MVNLAKTKSIELGRLEDARTRLLDVLIMDFLHRGLGELNGTVETLRRLGVINIREMDTEILANCRAFSEAQKKVLKLRTD